MPIHILPPGTYLLLVPNEPYLQAIGQKNRNPSKHHKSTTKTQTPTCRKSSVFIDLWVRRGSLPRSQPAYVTILHIHWKNKNTAVSYSSTSRVPSTSTKRYRYPRGTDLWTYIKRWIRSELINEYAARTACCPPLVCVTRGKSRRALLHRIASNFTSALWHY